MYTSQSHASDMGGYINLIKWHNILSNNFWMSSQSISFLTNKIILIIFYNVMNYSSNRNQRTLGILLFQNSVIFKSYTVCSCPFNAIGIYACHSLYIIQIFSFCKYITVIIDILTDSIVNPTCINITLNRCLIQQII